MNPIAPLLSQAVPGTHWKLDARAALKTTNLARFKTHPARYLVRANYLFDSACALSVMLVTFASVNIGRVPAQLDEFLAVRLTIRNLVFGILFLVIWQSSFALCGLYRTDLRERRRSQALRVLLSCTLATFLVSFFTLASRTGYFGPTVLGYFWLVATPLEIGGRQAIAAICRYLVVQTRPARSAVIVGSGPLALKLSHAIQTAHRHTKILGFVDTIDARIIPAAIRDRLICPLAGLETLLSTRDIDQVLIALPVKSCYEAMQEAIVICERVGVEVKYSPDIFSVSLARRAYHQEGELPAVRLQLVADDHRLIVKRAIDIAGALCGLALLCPLFAACAVAVKMSSPGPAIFTQVRYGYRRRLFRMYKFRTMVQEAEQLQSNLESRNEAQGPIFKIRADPRVTRVGRLLRRLSLDELPQLVNVLLGEMSLVGPRPMSMRDVSRFSESWLLRRFSVMPGLTCLWQISGRSNTTFDRWIELDLAYIDEWSLALDLQILAKTVPAVMKGAGAV